jgi:hypothetical protein
VHEEVEDHCRKEQIKRRVGRMSEEVGAGIRICYFFHKDKKKKQNKKKVEMCIL